MISTYRHVIKHYDQLIWPTTVTSTMQTVQGRIIHLHFPFTYFTPEKITLTILQHEHADYE